MTALRLIQPDGQPTLTRAEAKLIAEARAMKIHLDATMGLLEIGLRDDKPATVAIAARMLMSIGLHLNDYARAAGQ